MAPGSLIATRIRLLSLAAAFASALLAGGCVSIRGPVAGVAVDEPSGRVVEGLVARHYILRETRWPFQGEPSLRVALSREARTDRFGNFNFSRRILFRAPFVQRFSGERLILNLELLGDLEERAKRDGIYTHFWADPDYVKTVDGRFRGVVLDIRRSLFGRRVAPPDNPRPLPGAKFYRAETSLRSMGYVKVTRAEGAGEN